MCNCLVHRYLRKVLESIAMQKPVWAAIYCTYRDESKFQRLKFMTTPFGFDFTGNKTMQNGKFEPDETSLIQQYLMNSDVFVDIGANIGYYSCLARNMGKSVIAFEPIPSNLRLLYRNLEKNGWSDVEVIPMGLAELPSVTTIYGNEAGASLVNGWAGGSCQHQQIAVNTLDNIIGARFCGKRMLIKIDVEGVEWRVLNGAEKLLTRTPRPIWLVEITLSIHHPGVNLHFAKTFEKFWNNGYEARTADKNERLVTPEDVGRWVSKGVIDFGGINWVFS